MASLVSVSYNDYHSQNPKRTATVVFGFHDGKLCIQTYQTQKNLARCCLDKSMHSLAQKIISYIY